MFKPQKENILRFFMQFFPYNYNDFWALEMLQKHYKSIIKVFYMSCVLYLIF